MYRDWELIATCSCGKKCVIKTSSVSKENWWEGYEWVVFRCECGGEFVERYRDVKKKNLKRYRKATKDYIQEKLL